MRDLGRFVSDYPDISLDFIGSYEALSLTRGEADVAVRVTDSPPEHLIGRRLGQYAVAVYASTEYLTTHDPVASRVLQLDRLGNGPIDQRSDAP
jgi:DNA-binding transcriptional LysR family regulator